MPAEADTPAIVLRPVNESDQKQVLEWEYEVLGLYLSNHPVRQAIGNDLPRGFQSIARIVDMEMDQRVNLVALVRSVRRTTTRTNRSMAVAQVEDLTGSLEVVAFPNAYSRFSHLLEPDTVIVIEGKVDRRGDQVQILMDAATSRMPDIEDELPPTDDVVVDLYLSGDRWTDINQLQGLHSIMRRFVGDHPVELVVRIGDDIHRFRSRTLQVEWTEEFQEAVQTRLNRGGVRLRLRPESESDISHN